MNRKLIKVTNCDGAYTSPSTCWLYLGKKDEKGYTPLLCYLPDDGSRGCEKDLECTCLSPKEDINTFCNERRDYKRYEVVEPTPELLMMLRFRGCSTKVKIKAKNDKV